MTEDADDDGDHDDAAAHGDRDHNHNDHEADEGRVTSPMQDFSTKEAAIGGAVLAVGVAVAFLVPYALL